MSTNSASFYDTLCKLLLLEMESTNSQKLLEAWRTKEMTLLVAFSIFEQHNFVPKFNLCKATGFHD
jgi:hypothetical protein